MFPFKESEIYILTIAYILCKNFNNFFINLPQLELW